LKGGEGSTDTVLQGSASQTQLVLGVECKHSLCGGAVAILDAMSFIQDNSPPLDLQNPPHAVSFRSSGKLESA